MSHGFNMFALQVKQKNKKLLNLLANLVILIRLFNKAFGLFNKAFEGTVALN